jgi:hypothetical protein
LIGTPNDCRGCMTPENFWADAEVISTYSRAQAIEDGVLVDLCQAGDFAKSVKEAGFKFPIACTTEVFAECIGLTKAAEKAGNDINGRLWDVLWMLKCAIRRAKNTDRIEFVVRIVRDRVRPTPTELVAVCGPGDNAEPVITIMFPGQD